MLSYHTKYANYANYAVPPAIMLNSFALCEHIQCIGQRSQNVWSIFKCIINCHIVIHAAENYVALYIEFRKQFFNLAK